MPSARRSSAWSAARDSPRLVFCRQSGCQLALVVLVPGLLALVFGWLAFRSRVTGVYLSILTQAMTLALSLYLFQNDSGLRGNNGLSGLQNLPGLTEVPQSVVSVWFFWPRRWRWGSVMCFAAWVVSGKFGNVITASAMTRRGSGSWAIRSSLQAGGLHADRRDRGDRGRALLSRRRASSIRRKSRRSPRSIWRSGWRSAGAAALWRGHRRGLVSLLSSWFTGGQVPSIPLGFYTIDWVDWWQVLLGFGFVLVTLFAPKGLAGCLTG
jgi:urea transport system permease protein